MPRINLTEVLSFSSEDPNNPADNLILGQSFRKWKIANTEHGKQASVTLKLEHLSTVRSLDIGNEGCAFVEVLVARDDDKYEVLLPSSSFMSPVESRNLTDMNRVRMFGREKLTKATADQKWSRVKLVCTQPFNKQLQFGLAFITLNAPDSNTTNPVGEVRVGGLLLRDEQEDGEELVVGSLFAKLRAKATRVPTAPSNDAGTSPATKRKIPDDVGFYQLKKKPNAMQDEGGSSSPSMTKNNLSNSTKLDKNTNVPVKDSNIKANISDSSDIGKGAAKGKDDREIINKRKAKPAAASNAKKDSGGVNNRRTVDITVPTASQTDTPLRNRTYVPFSCLLGSIVYAMSGYQNPKRSRLRDKMTAMGAQYRADWDKTCTHLVCAFSKTPKFNIVKGKGKIVSHRWVEECHALKKKMNWKRYQLDSDCSSDDSAEEVWAEELRPRVPRTEHKVASGDGTQTSKLPTDAPVTNERAPTPSDAHAVGTAATRLPTAAYDKLSDSDQDYGGATSEEDTDDEIYRVLNRNQPPAADPGKCNGSGQMSESDDAYDDDTDEDTPTKGTKHLSELPSPFTGEVFFLYDQPSNEDCLRRYIRAYDGRVNDYMDDSVHIVITDKQWDTTFDEALKSHSQLQFVRPSWVWKCSENGLKVPLLPHKVSRET